MRLLKVLFLYRANIFIDFDQRKFVELFFNEQSAFFLNVNGDDPAFFLYSVKTSKSRDSCNNINNPIAKSCVPDVVKNFNVKAFNLVSGINETRRIEWHEMCKSKGRLNSSVCNNKQRWNDDKCRCECKEFIDKGLCLKGFTWNPSNCECECYKSCDFSKYLDYKNCECKKRLADKLAERSPTEECTENIEETRLVKITSAKNENKHKRSIGTLYIVLFSIFFTINVGIGIYFICFCWYLQKDVSRVNNLMNKFMKSQTKKSQTNRDQKSNLLFLQRHNQSQKFRIKLVKDRQKTLQRHWYLLYWIHYN